MKRSIISYLFPLSLCTLIGISTFILNIITDIDPIEKKKYRLEVIATFLNTSIIRYNKNGEIEHKINAKKIEQLSNNKYILYDANIKKYNNNNKLSFNSKASKIQYNPITGDLFLNNDNNKNKGNKIKVILYDKKIFYDIKK